MAKTFPTKALAVTSTHDAFLTFAQVTLPEGASQTWPAHSPVKWASGYIAEWVSVADADIAGFAEEAGNNGTAGANDQRIVLALPGIELEANFLDAAAADEVFVQATDLGVTAGLTKGANLLGTGLAGWYFEDGGTAAVITTQLAEAPISFNDRVDYAPEDGDTNVRIRARVVPGVSLYF